MKRRTALAVQAAVLLAFAVFFVVPLLWLVLAPTKTDSELLRGTRWRWGASPTSGTRGSRWTVSSNLRPANLPTASP